jgi:hypothetical protein
MEDRREVIKRADGRKNKNNLDLDQMSGTFGKIMAEIMAYKPDMWEEQLRQFGFYLGKFIYLMDAYEIWKRI